MRFPIIVVGNPSNSRFWSDRAAIRINCGSHSKTPRTSSGVRQGLLHRSISSKVIMILTSLSDLFCGILLYYVIGGRITSREEVMGL